METKFRRSCLVRSSANFFDFPLQYGEVVKILAVTESTILTFLDPILVSVFIMLYE